MKTNFGSVDSLLNYDQSSLRKKQIENNREIMRRIVEVVLLIGKRGLSYRGKNYEAAYTLDDASLDHGNFIEIIILLSKYDRILKLHLDKIVNKSTKSHNLGSKQGGRNITFLSKTTVNYIIEAISVKIKSTIFKEIQTALHYSIQIDTTQDISVIDQCSVIIRFTNEAKVYERLIATIKCTSSKGADLAQLIF